MRPKKHFGQNFLTSLPGRAKIVAAGNLIPTDFVVEVGPGKGFLTEALLATGAHVEAIEKDNELIPLLQEKFKQYIDGGQFAIIDGDVLAYTPPERDYKVVANIPYYITGAILRHFLERKHSPSLLVLLMQEEVAKRIMARDGKASLLSLSVQVYGTPKIITRIDRGSFFPKPSVDSAVLSIEKNPRSSFENTKHEETFFRTIHAGFSHKRKILFSNCKELAPPSILEGAFTETGLQKTVRAEDVTLDEWLRLSSILYKFL